jgi:SlyX protein
MSPPPMTEDGFPVNAQKLEQIEIKIAFLERANVELSDVVFRQHREIEILRAQVVGLAARIEAVQSETAVRMPENERPPHY